MLRYTFDIIEICNEYASHDLNKIEFISTLFYIIKTVRHNTQKQIEDFYGVALAITVKTGNLR